MKDTHSLEKILEIIQYIRRIITDKTTMNIEGPSVNKEYLSQIQFYSIFSKLPAISNTVVMITVCVKVANSTFLVINN